MNKKYILVANEEQRMKRGSTDLFCRVDQMV